MPRLACQDVGKAVARQRVAKARAGQILDPQIAVALRLAPVCARCAKIGHHPRQRPGMAGHVPARTPLQPVRPKPANEHIIAVAAKKRVIARSPRQRVVACTPVKTVIARKRKSGVVAQRAEETVGQVCQMKALDPDVGVARSLACGEREVHEIKGNRRRAFAVACHVETGVALQPVCPKSAHQRIVVIAALQQIVAKQATQEVVAIKADQRVRLGVARQAVVMIRAFNLFDAKIHIAGCLTGMTGRVGQVDHHPDIAVAVGYAVAPGTAVKVVRAGPAIQGVVALTAKKAVGPARPGQPVAAIATIKAVGKAITGQLVGKPRSDDTFDREICLSGCQTGILACAFKVDANGRRGCQKVDTVKAAAAGDRVGSDRDQEDVVRSTALQEIGLL